MNTVDINSLSVEELKKLTKKAEHLISKRRDKEVISAYQVAMQAAQSVDLSLEELVEFGKNQKIGTSRKPVAIRYRDSDHPENTWTGRGKQPRWLAAKLAAGAKLSDFEV